MSRTHLKNYCIEPESKECSCVLLLCGGLLLASLSCLEHGENAASRDILKTHFHPIQGQAVGTGASQRYDDAKAS